MLKDINFYHLRENIKKLLDTVLDFLKTASKKVVHKRGEVLGNKIADVVITSNDDKFVKQDSFYEIIIQLEKGEEILDKLRKVL